MSSQAHTRKGFLRQCEVEFQLELSRGASCIASCRSDATVQEVVHETVLVFLETHGPEGLTAFRSLLADRLVARGRPEAASIVVTYSDQLPRKPR